MVLYIMTNIAIVIAMVIIYFVRIHFIRIIIWFLIIIYLLFSFFGTVALFGFALMEGEPFPFVFGIQIFVVPMLVVAFVPRIINAIIRKLNSRRKSR